MERLWVGWRDLKEHRITESWCGWVEKILKVTEPWNRGMVVLEGTLRTVEPWNYGTVGLEGPQRGH